MSEREDGWDGHLRGGSLLGCDGHIWDSMKRGGVLKIENFDISLQDSFPSDFHTYERRRLAGVISGFCCSR